MKKRICIPAVLLGVILLAGGLVLSRRTATIHEADIQADAQRFIVDFTALDTTLEHTLPLEEGDTLKCSWKISDGKVNLMIRYEDGTKMYQGSNLDEAEFKLIAEKSGTCTISLKGWNGAGWLSILRS